MSISDNVKQVQSIISSHFQEVEPTLIAVTKSVGVDVANALYAEGIRDFGENRPDALLEKVEGMPKDARFHFIGTLQTRKVKQSIVPFARLSISAARDNRSREWIAAT